jgi:hypothetical protein
MIVLKSQRYQFGRLCAQGALLVAVLGLAGCFSAKSEPATEDTGPITLAPKQTSATTGNGVLSGNVDENELRKAVDRYRIMKQRGDSPYNFASADLNGDGRSEVLVLYSGADWCQKTGCSLVVFQMEQTGYKAVSHIVSAQAPISIGPDASFGWRDLIVKTGGGGSPERNARLGFVGKGYPTNALLQPEPTRETLAQSQQIMAPAQAAAAPATN